MTGDVQKLRKLDKPGKSESGQWGIACPRWQPRIGMSYLWRTG
jgi:hypothetical protein